MLKFGGRFFQTKLLSRLSHIKVCRLLPSSVLLRTSVYSAYAFDKVKIQFFCGLNDPFCCFSFFCGKLNNRYKWWWYYPLRKCRRSHLGIRGFIYFNMYILFSCCFSISETHDFLSLLLWNTELCARNILLPKTIASELQGM